MKKLFSLSLLVLTFSAALAQTQPVKFYSYADAKLQTGDTLGALNACHQVVAGNCSWESYTAQGLIKYLEKDYSGAVTDYDKAIRNVADYAPAYYFRGLAVEMLGQSKEAFDDYSKALDLDPLLSKSYLRRASIYSKVGTLNLALQDLNHAFFLNPLLDEALFLRAEVYGRLGDYKLQIKDYNKLVKLKSGSPEVYYLRGLAKVNVGKLQDALEDFNAALALQPDLQKAQEQKQLIQSYLSQSNEKVMVLNKK